MNFLLNASNNSLSSFFSDIKNVFSTNFTGLNALKSVIEILLLTIVFMFLLKFFKGKKSSAIFIGVVLCFVIIVLADIFELNAIYKLFSTFIDFGALAILIVFHPEIRDALEHLGVGSISGIMNFSDRKKKKEMYYNVIEHICSAVKELSAEYTGALIVIERTTRLSDVLGSGVAINADVNSLLIRNLFYNKAPLHDGALVISDGKIAAAGCFLPLTRRTDIDTELGTRHRAALGISESSDSITIVVSEETGHISVAYDCTLHRDFTVESLREFLMDNILKSSYDFVK